MKLVLSLDSGAHSLYNIHVAGKTDKGEKLKGMGTGSALFARSRADFSYYDKPEFWAYVDSYVDFIKKHSHEFDFYVTIDAIFHAEKTDEVQRYLEKKGIKPLPVLHYGEGVEFLKKMLDKYEYIGIGGLGQEVSVPRFARHGDVMFKYLTDKKGKPIVRTHGFAMTSFPLLTRYPWHSVDSTAPFVFSRNGSIITPKMHIRNGKVTFDYNTIPYPIAVTNRRSKASKYYKALPPDMCRSVEEYVRSLGYTMEQVAADGVVGYAARDVVNCYYMEQMQYMVRERNGLDFLYYASGKASAGTTGDFLANLKRKGVKEFNYLGTYHIIKPTFEFLDYRKAENGNGSPRPRLKTGRPVLARV